MSKKILIMAFLLLLPFYSFAIEASESFKKADDFFKQGKFEMALLFYNREINERPDNGQAYFRRGKIHFYNKAYTNALLDFKRASDILPKNKDILYAKANALAMTGEFDSAIDEYGRLLKMDKKFAYAYLNLGNIYLRNKKDKESTIQNWETFLELLPDYEQADDIRKAIAYLRSAEFSWNQIDPDLQASDSKSGDTETDKNATNATSDKLDLDSILPDLDISGEGTKADVSKQKGMADKKSIETE